MDQNSEGLEEKSNTDIIHQDKYEETIAINESPTPFDSPQKDYSLDLEKAESLVLCKYCEFKIESKSATLLELANSLVFKTLDNLRRDSIILTEDRIEKLICPNCLGVLGLSFVIVWDYN